MRTLICLLASIAAASAAVEQFTLTDGRTFIGEYDDVAGQLHTLIGKKAVSLTVAKDQIAEREVYRPKKQPHADAASPAVSASIAPPPKAMKPADKAAAERDAAWGRKLHDADRLDAEAAKAVRDAAGARRDAERKTDEAAAHWRAFKLRAHAEGMAVPDEPTEKLYVLPRTFGNSRATTEAVALSRKAMRNAAGFEALAVKKAAEAATARAEAGMMPHGER
jgi:hypothetical protein